MSSPKSPAVGARSTTAVAHRGDPYRFRENTLPSIRSALEAGAGAVEVDVRLTRDGVPVLLHDATLERLWGLTRVLDSLSADELRELTGGGVPTLREALHLGAGYSGPRLFIDLPDASAAEAAVAEVHESGATGRVYYCGGAASMLAVRRADADAETALTWTTLMPPRRALLTAVAPRWLNYRFGLVSPELVARNHSDGLLVSAWTADTRFTMRRLLASGVDAITTNRVGTLRSLLRG
ncbi:glycerophosphodiester phosphodiesterase [Streptosporangium nondiastaticum]|uniref:Glycerophosphodiester phosphodiesterase n=1 Tax=Streptosporangium nondiastaticum TaxID=35764 RepID=A0A9X7PH79_9ACTN|nr:glycerophosphodiester phosphodiesterase [Streptosporangium nondiastaticum]PSJ27849.1 glycerophosphodiester phosphodiesterase [Streptosporangium nondiastaticum]